jgi:hypothetical protein
LVERQDSLPASERREKVRGSIAATDWAGHALRQEAHANPLYPALSTPYPRLPEPNLLYALDRIACGWSDESANRSHAGTEDKSRAVLELSNGENGSGTENWRSVPDSFIRPAIFGSPRPQGRSVERPVGLGQRQDALDSEHAHLVAVVALAGELNTSPGAVNSALQDRAGQRGRGANERVCRDRACMRKSTRCDVRSISASWYSKMVHLLASSRRRRVWQH